MSLTLSRPFTIETYDPPSTRRPQSYAYNHAFDLHTDIPQAQALGGRSQGKRSTPPDTQPSDFNKTPP